MARLTGKPATCPIGPNGPVGLSAQTINNLSGENTMKFDRLERSETETARSECLATRNILGKAIGADQFNDVDCSLSIAIDGLRATKERIERIRAAYRSRKERDSIQRCRECNSEFEPKSKDQKYCSAHCQWPNIP